MMLQTTLGQIWNGFKDQFRSPAAKEPCFFVEPDRVRSLGAVNQPIEPGKHYIQLWLCEMYLALERDWFKTWSPLVYSNIQLRFANQTVEIPYVAGELNLGGIKPTSLGTPIVLNKDLTPIIPYTAGTVNISAGLLATQRTDKLDQFVNVISDFAGLLNIPQVSTVLNLAGRVSTGVNTLLNVADRQMHLGMDFTLAPQGASGSNTLRSGYIVAIRDTHGQLDARLQRQLWVINDRLHIGETPEQCRPFTGFDYMLFRIDAHPARPEAEWLKFKEINDSYNRAEEAMLGGQASEAAAYLNRAMLAVRSSEDLIRADKQRALLVLREHFEEFKQNAGLGAAPDNRSSLAHVMALALPPDQALRLDEPSHTQFLQLEQ